MKTATSLTVIALGAILAFAITGSPGFLNVQVAGWVLILTGVAGLLLSRPNRDWFRRKVIIRDPAKVSRPRPSPQPSPRPSPQPTPRPRTRPSLPAPRPTDEYIER
jgi:hypothetical protein